MKKILLTHWLLVLIEYTAIYLIITFCIWEFTNPFQWLIDLPTYDFGVRFLILFFFVFWHGIQIFLIKESFKPKPNEKT